MYASVEDMVKRFGESEMLRVSVADGMIPEEIVPARIEGALADASRLIDSYLRVRYRVPVSPVPDELIRAACVLARYDLATGGDRHPAEEMRLARKEVLAWLVSVSKGEASLEGVAPVSSGAAARTSDRERVLTHDNLGSW